jgi:hypothetical protein
MNTIWSVTPRFNTTNTRQHPYELNPTHYMKITSYDKRKLVAVHTTTAYGEVEE